MLQRVRVSGFKSLRDVEVRLAPLVVVFGPNSTGKSNLVEALLLLSRLATARTFDEAFTSPVRGYPAEMFSLPEGGLRALYESPAASMSFEADVSTPASNGQRKGEGLRYRIAVRLKPESGQLTLEDESLAWLDPRGNPKSRPAPPIRGTDDLRLAIPSTRPGHPLYEPLGVNHAYVSNPRFTGASYDAFVRLREEFASWRIYYLDPRKAMREPQPPREVEDIGPAGEYLAPLLNRLKEAPDRSDAFHAVRRALRQAIPSVESLNVQLDTTRGNVEVDVVQDGTPFSSRVISEGTLRVLALCVLAANPWAGRLMAFEEPENGVHPSRIEVITDILANIASRPDQQVIVTTHSPAVVASMLRRKRGSPQSVALVVCQREGSNSRYRALDDIGELWDDALVRQSLADDDDACVASMLKKGWFDG